MNIEDAIVAQLAVELGPSFSPVKARFRSELAQRTRDASNQSSKAETFCFVVSVPHGFRSVAGTPFVNRNSLYTGCEGRLLAAEVAGCAVTNYSTSQVDTIGRSLTAHASAALKASLNGTGIDLAKAEAAVKTAITKTLNVYRSRAAKLNNVFFTEWFRQEGVPGVDKRACKGAATSTGGTPANKTIRDAACAADLDGTSRPSSTTFMPFVGPIYWRTKSGAECRCDT